jgi:hypothetical protein
MDRHKHAKTIRPTSRWDSGAHEQMVVVETDLALPNHLDYDEKEFTSLQKWTEEYRDRLFPGLQI